MLNHIVDKKTKLSKQKKKISQIAYQVANEVTHSAWQPTVLLGQADGDTCAITRLAFKLHGPAEFLADFKCKWDA